MKLHDILESSDVSFVDDAAIADENEKRTVPSDMGPTSAERDLVRQSTLSGRGKNYKKARAITRMAKKKVEDSSNVRDDTDAQIGPDFSRLNFRR